MRSRSSRALIVAVVVAGPAVNHAEPAIELGAGAAVPVASSDWRDDARTGFALAGRGTSHVRGQRAVVGMEWARLPITGFDRFDRFRILVGPAGWWRLSSLSVSARIALGVDAVSVRTGNGAAAGLPQQRTDFDLGVGAEAAATVWLYEGDVDVGFELGVPVAIHWSEAADADSPSFDYRGIDLQTLLAVRVR